MSGGGEVQEGVRYPGPMSKRRYPGPMSGGGVDTQFPCPEDGTQETSQMQLHCFDHNIFIPDIPNIQSPIMDYF